MRARARLLMSLLVVCATASGCRGGSNAKPLGPHDGFDLRPDDLARVRVGDRAPDFTLTGADGRSVSLSDYRGRFVTLVFYRGHW